MPGALARTSLPRAPGNLTLRVFGRRRASCPVEVYGTGGALLDSREVFFLVPPEFEGPGGPG